MKNIILIGLLSITLLGCMTEKKQRHIAEDYYRLHQEELALKCAEKYPVRQSFVQGITIKRIDSTFQKGIVLNCPPVFDSITRTVNTPKIVCPDVKIIKETTERVDTVKEEDTARIDALQLENNRLKVRNGITEKMAKDRLKLLLLFLVISALLIWMRIKKI